MFQMGSTHSGRRNGKPLVEDCLSLDLAWLMRLGPLREGEAGSGDIKWSQDGNAIGTLRFRLDLRTTETSQLILRYTIATPGGERRPMRQAIALIALTQHFGGRRWWMRCPVTGERVRVLYLPPDGERFASREAWGLAYRVERLSHFDRPFEKLFRAQRRLGGSQGLAAGLVRPKGMWQRTYARHHGRFAEFDIACAMELGALIEKSTSTR